METSMIKSIRERIFLPVTYCCVLIALTACGDGSGIGGHYFSTHNDDAGTVSAGSSLSISVLDNDTVENRDDANFTYTKVLDRISEQPKKGTAVIYGSSILYTPSANRFGNDTFVYQSHLDAKHASDPQLDVRLTGALATVTIRIEPTSGTVDAIFDSAKMTARNQLIVNVLANDVGNSLEIKSVTPPDESTGVSARATSDNKAIIVTSGEAGTVRFSYSCGNPTGAMDSANVSIEIFPAFSATIDNKSDSVATFQIGEFGYVVAAQDFDFVNFATPPNAFTKVVVTTSQPFIGIFEADFDSFDSDVKTITFDPDADPPVQVTDGGG